MNNSIIKTTPQILKDNICTVFNLLNLLIAISLAAVVAWKNILFIFIILINTAVGIVQEIKAKRRIEKLTLLSLPKVKTVRDGKETEILPDEIKKGDVLCLESGSVICCDCQIISGMAEINESVLTGESEPVVKQSGDTLLAGSSLIYGKCRAEVICENEDSFASKITNEVKSTKQSGSEMLMSMKKVTKFTGFFIVPLGILMFIQGYFFRGTPLADTVVSVSAGLLGMLPKGLVLLISIGFAAGVISLSKKQVLVRELHSLENLAHCDTVCLDKTGTLTEGKLSVESVFAYIDNNEFEKLMSAMQKKGHKVAMTGDGVNDLLAMRQADCSAAMGAGCDAAKQTAQLVLLNSDFTVLKDVISEGRRVINNLTKLAGVFFIKTIYSVLLCVLCLLFNTDFSFIPIQITLIDAVIEAFPAFFMSFKKMIINVKKVFCKQLSARLFQTDSLYLCAA